MFYKHYILGNVDVLFKETPASLLTARIWPDRSCARPGYGNNHSHKVFLSGLQKYFFEHSSGILKWLLKCKIQKKTPISPNIYNLVCVNIVISCIVFYNKQKTNRQPKQYRYVAGCLSSLRLSLFHSTGFRHQMGGDKTLIPFLWIKILFLRTLA